MPDHKLLSALMRPFLKRGAETWFTAPDFLRDDSRILCIDSGDLSGLLFHMPLLTAIRRRYSGTCMDFLMLEKHAPLVVPSGLARECLLYKPGQLNPWRPSFASLLRQVGGGAYDAALITSFSPHPSLEMALMASGASLRFGPSHPAAWPAVNLEVRCGDGVYLGDHLKHAAPFLGFSPSDLEPRWPLPVEKVKQIAQQVHFHKPNQDQMLVGVDPGVSKNGHSFALENLQFLMRQLSSRLECKVIPLGDPEQHDRLARLDMMLSNVPSGLCRDTLLDCALLLSQCDLFVAGNTDFLHFAVAMGVPSVGLFTSSEPACWHPTGRSAVRILSVEAGVKVDIDALLEAVEAVTGDRWRASSTVLSDPADPDGTGPSAATDGTPN